MTDMKITTHIARIIVGILFIFSGLVKANDPLGLSYKMQEFFELWHMTRFNSWTLALSVLMNAFEIIAGVALLIGWRIRLFGWLLLLLIIFFTFLTGYTYVTGKPANCGCFGDCLPISSKTSFQKDLVLTVLIAFLLWQQKYIRPLFPARTSGFIMLLAVGFSFGLQWYSLRYLPPVDCLPYKKGNNIPQQMQVPANAIPDSTVIEYVYKKQGQEVRFTADNFPDDFDDSLYQYVDRHDKLIRAGVNNLPPIRGFALTGISGEDSTTAVLEHEYALLLFVENLSTPLSAWSKEFATIYAEAREKNIPVYIITGTRDALRREIAGTPFAGVPLFTCDNTAIRTAARTNPCLFLLQKGTILGKWSYTRMSQASRQLAAVPAQPSPLPSPPVQDSGQVSTTEHE